MNRVFTWELTSDDNSTYWEDNNHDLSLCLTYSRENGKKFVIDIEFIAGNPKNIYIEGRLYMQVPNNQYLEIGRLLPLFYNCKYPEHKEISTDKMLMFNPTNKYLFKYYITETRHPVPKGLENKHNLCYFNAAIQPLVNIPIFRKFIFDIPIGDRSLADNVVLSQLQRLFGLMQISPFQTHNINDLAASFGWGQDFKNYRADSIEFLDYFFDRLKILLLKYPESNRKFYDLINTVYSNDTQCIFQPIIRTTLKGKTLAESVQGFFNEENNTRRIEKLPMIFFVQLVYDDSLVRTFSYSTILDLKPYCSNQDQVAKYKLIGFIVYKAPHYQAIVVNESGPFNRWFNLSDEYVREIEKQTIINYNTPESGYVRLFIFARTSNYKEIMTEIPDSAVPKAIHDEKNMSISSYYFKNHKSFGYYTNEDLIEVCKSGSCKISEKFIHRVEVPEESNEYLKYLKEHLQKRGLDIDQDEISCWMTDRTNHLPLYKIISMVDYNQQVVFVIPNKSEPILQDETKTNRILFFILYSAITNDYKYMGFEFFHESSTLSDIRSRVSTLLNGCNTYRLFYKNNSYLEELLPESEQMVKDFVSKSFFYVQIYSDEERSASPIKSQPELDFIKIDDLCPCILSSVSMMKSAITINFVDFYGHTVPLAIPRTFTFQKLRKYVPKAFNSLISQNNEEKEDDEEKSVVTIDFMFKDPRIMRPCGLIIPPNYEVTHFPQNSTVFFSKQRLMQKHFLFIIEIVKDPFNPIFRRIQIMSGTDIGTIVNKFQEEEPGLVPDHRFYLLRKWNNTFSINTEKSKIRTEMTAIGKSSVLEIISLSHTPNEDEIVLRCFVCFYGLDGITAIPSSEPFCVIVNKTDGNSEIKTKISEHLQVKKDWEFKVALFEDGTILRVDDLAISLKNPQQYFIALRDPDAVYDNKPISYHMTYDCLKIYN